MKRLNCSYCGELFSPKSKGRRACTAHCQAAMNKSKSSRKRRKVAHAPLSPRRVPRVTLEQYRNLMTNTEDL
jgi:hypothetical protein